MTDITDAGPRLRAMNDALTGFDQMRAEIERLRANQRDRREQIAADMPRWQTLPLLERLRDHGAAMKCVPLFAVATMREAAALVESLRREVREQRQEIAGLREERRALLEADRPQPERPEAIATGESDRPEPIGTPNPHATPGECSVPPEWTYRPYWVDPPSGWRYGFPRLYDPAADGDMTEWMIANGYPEKLARQGLACTFTEYRTETGEK